MDDEIFRQKGPGVARGEAVDANPSERSGGGGSGTPIWKSFITNESINKRDRVAIANEQRAIASKDNESSAPHETWGGDNGRLLRKTRNGIEQFDAELYTEDPNVGGFARKSLFDREKRTAAAEYDSHALRLEDPAFKAKQLSKKAREDIELEGSVLAETDPRHKQLKAQLVADDEYRAERADLEQRKYDAKVKATNLGNTDHESWWSSREAPAPVDPVQTAVAQRDEADAADQSAMEEEKALGQELAGGVPAARLQEIQARQAEISQARALAGEKKVEAGQAIEGVKQQAKEELKPALEKDFWNTGDVISGIWDSVRGLGATAPAAFAQLTEGLVRPDQYSDSAKAAFAEADAWNKEMQAKTAANQAAGTSSSAGETFRELGSSLAASGINMASQLAVKVPLTLAGVGTGAAAGAAGGPAAPVTSPVGAVVGGIGSWAASEAPALAAGAATAYRMAGAAYLNDAFNYIKQVKGRELTPEESADYYEKLLPHAQNTAMAESVPEALGNSISLKGIGAIAGIGKTAVAGTVVKNLAGRMKDHAITGAKMLLGELSTETITAQYQNPDQKIAEAIAHGEDISGIKPDWSLGGIAESAKGVAPQVVAQTALMAGVGGGIRGGLKAIGAGRPDTSQPDDGITQTTTALRAIDPEAPAPSADEVVSAASIVNPNRGFEGFAEGVRMERAMKIISTEDDASLAAAEEALTAAKASGDTNAVTLAEEGKAKVQGRAEGVRAVLKIAAGKQLEDLTKAELASLGFNEGEKGKTPTPMSDEELAKVGLDDIQVTLREDPETEAVDLIIRDAAIKRVTSILPAAANFVTNEETAIAGAQKRRTEAAEAAKAAKISGQAPAQLSTEQQNGEQGDPATGLQFPLETNAPVETFFDVPVRTGPPVRVQANSPQEAELAVAGMFAPHENGVLPNQAVAVAPNPNALPNQPAAIAPGVAGGNPVPNPAAGIQPLVEGSSATPIAADPGTGVPGGGGLASPLAVGQTIVHGGIPRVIADIIPHPSTGSPVVSFTENPQSYVFPEPQSNEQNPQAPPPQAQVPMPSVPVGTPTPANAGIAGGSAPIAGTPQAEVQGAVARDTSKPEQMTPDDWANASKARQDQVYRDRIKRVEMELRASSPDSYEIPKLEAELKSLQSRIIKNQNWKTEELTGSHPFKIEEAASNSQPVSAAAVETYGVKLPEGYVREGELYVFRGDPSTLPNAKKTKPAAVAKARTIIAEHRSGVLKTLTPEILSVAQETGMPVTNQTTLEEVVSHLDAKFPTVKIEDIPKPTVAKVSKLVTETLGVWKKNPAINSVLKLDTKFSAKAETVEGSGVHLNPQLLVQEIATAGLSDADAKVWLDRVLFEELHHLSQLQTFREIYLRQVKAKETKLSFEKWREAYSKTLIQEFKSIKFLETNENGDTVEVSLYEKAVDAYGVTLKAKGTPAWQQVSEINRMILQDMMTGNPTEATKAALGVKEIRDFINQALESLKAFVAEFRADSSNFSKDLIENMDRVEELLKQYGITNVTDQNQSRPRTPKADSAQPAQSKPSVGTSITPAQGGDSSPSGNGGTQQASSNGAGSPLQPGQRVEFEHKGIAGTGVVRLASKEAVSIYPDSNPGAAILVPVGSVRSVVAPLADTPQTPAEAPKKARRKVSVRYSRIQEMFASNPFVASIMAQEGVMSASRAKKEMGAEWWAANKSQYDDAPTFSNPTFNAIYSKTGQLTPNRVAEAIADDGFMATGDVSRMWAEVRKAAESTTNQNKNTTKEIEKESVASKQAVAFAEKNQERIGSVPVQVGDFEVGMEMVIDGVSLTVEANDGETVLLSDGEQFGKQSLSVENDVWLDVDDSSFFGEEDIEIEANQIVDEAEKQGYQSPDDFIAANPEPTFQQEGDSAANAGNGGNAGSENGSVPPQDGKSQVKRPTSKMDVKNADSRELFADDGGFKLGQDNTVDGAKIAAERKAKEDAKAAADAAQGDMFGEKAKPALTPDEQALKDAFSDMVDGLEAAPLIEPDPYQSKGIPRDKRAAFMDVADQLYDAGVRTPADLAAKLEKVGGGKLRAYSDAVWSVLRSNYPTLPQANDWAGVYSKINDSNSNDSTPSTSLEPDSSNAGTPNGGGKNSVSAGRGATRGNGKRVVSTGNRGGNPAQSDLQPNDSASTPERDGSDQQSPESTPEPEERPSNPDNADGSRVPDADGVEAYGRGENDTHDGLVIPAVAPTLAQGGIEGVRDVVDVKKSAPALKVEQAEDVVFVEKRFEKHPGALLTNGTGTGKTFSGLGVVKRALDRGEKHIIIIAPSDKVVNDWIDTAREFFGIRDIAQLDGIRDNSATNRVVVTTYANFGQNNELVARPWGLVVTDEAHYLAQAKDGNSTLAQKTHKGLTWHPKEGVRSRLNMELAEEMAEMSALNKSIDGNNRLMNRDDTMDQARYAYQEENRKLEARWNILNNKVQSRLAELQKVAAGMKKEDRPKSLFLSATPFAYHFSLDYAEGYLFEHGPEPTSTRYNTPSARSKFYMENFGYRMRYGKLTQPENAAATGILERMFAEKLKRDGAMRGRMLAVPFDYSRDFVLAESAIGQKIDEVLTLIRNEKRFTPLRTELEIADYLARRYLLEGLKAREAVKRIKEHLALGRKVVVFHDYKKNNAINPLRLRSGEPEAVKAYDQLRAEFTGFDELVLSLDSLRSPIDVIRANFPDARMFNGDVSKKNRRDAVKDFNLSGGKVNVILAQRAAGKEGISLHDIDSKHQRAFVDLGLPGRPTDAIQSEGRTIRLGMQSNGVLEYLTTGTDFERHTFAQTIATRASTAENLAMGESARALLQAFSVGYNDARSFRPSNEQGTGGKQSDAARESGDPFDNAVALYFTNQKKTSRNKAEEGVDYFATPEPLGFKMVEWAGIRPGERVLEPSGGHGAIARFFPDSTTRHAVEPSYELAGRLALNAPDTKIHQVQFEDYDVVNKFDAIVMNPPFGTAGKTAMDHLEKAVKHLKEGGRVVALIPNGSSMAKRFDKWYESVEGVFMAAEIQLPSVTFERAGTSVSARIVILDKGKYNDSAQTTYRDFTDASTTKALFERLKESTVADRPTPAVAKTPAEMMADLLGGGRSALIPKAEKPQGIDGAFSSAEFNHTKTGAAIFVARIDNKLSDSEYSAAKSLAKKHGGYYQSYNKGGAIPGFHFPDADSRDGFLSAAMTPGDTGTTLRAAELPAMDRHAELEARKDSLTPEELAEAQALVDAAAKAAGYAFKVKHGSPKRVITSFDVDLLGGNTKSAGATIGFFVTSRKDIANSDHYVGRKYEGDWPNQTVSSEGKVHELFVKSDKPYLTRSGDQLEDILANDLRPLFGGKHPNGKQIRDYLLRNGYDSVRYAGAMPDDFTASETIILNPEQIKSAEPFTGVPLSERFNSSSPSILQTAPLPSTPAKKARDAFNANREKFENAQEQVKALGSGTAGADPKFANPGASPKARDAFDIARMIDSNQREIKKDRDTHAQGREFLEKYPEEVERLLLESGYGDNPEFTNDYRQHAINLLLNRKAEAASTTADYEQLYMLATANVILGREQARAFRQRMDKFLTPAERAHAAIADAIFTPSKKIAARAEVMKPAERKAFLADEGKKRIAEVEKALAKRDLSIQQIQGKNRDLQLVNSRLEKEVLGLRNTLEQDIIRFVQKGASMVEIQKRFGKLGAEQAGDIITKARKEIGDKLREMLRSGMSQQDIREAMKDTLKAAPLGESSALTPDQIEAIVSQMLEQDFGLPEVIRKRPLPTARPKKPVSEIEAHPLAANWSRPEFSDHMKTVVFDLKDRHGIMERVEIIRGLAGALGKIDSLTGEKRTKAEAALADINKTLAKYDTDAKGIFEGTKSIESYRFDINDVAHVALVARTINSLDADFVDKASEYLYFSMLSGLQTMMVNAMAIAPAAWESTVGRGVNMAINHFVKDPMAEQYGEGKYIVRALGTAIARAKSNFKASMAAQHPMFDRDVNAMEVDWDKILGGGSHRMVGSIAGRKGDIIRLPMRLLTATDDFNRTLIAVAEVGTFAYRMAKMDGLKDGSPEMDAFIRKEVNTAGSLSYQMASRKASKAIYSNPLPGQHDPHMKKIDPTSKGFVETNDMGDFVGYMAGRLTDAVSKDHDNIFIKAVSAALRVAFFPFQRTPFNIIRKGVRHTLNPFSLADIAMGVVRNTRVDGKWQWAIEGKDQTAMNRHIHRAELIERMGQQLQGAVLMTALYALAWGEGDDDDQDQKFIITGSSPFLPTGMAERDARMRSGVGPFRMSWMNKDGSERLGFSYGRIEPVATILAATIDMMKSFKRADRSGKDTYDAGMAAMGGLISQAQDKSFMKGIGDFIKLSSSVMTEPDLRENRKALQFLASRAAMVVPNIIKQPLRESDTQFRDRADGFMQSLMYEVAPIGQKPAKVDPYGKKLTKPGVAPLRPIDPTDIGSDSVNTFDRVLLKWSDKHPDKAWFPSPIMKGEFKHARTGAVVEMNQAQLTEFRDIAGKRVTAMLKRAGINMQNPTELDLKKIKEAHTDARSEAKKLVAFKYSR